MALVSMRELLDHAAENGYGVPAFNVNNIEQVQAIMTAAAEVDAPVIMQASAGARKYAPGPRSEPGGLPDRHAHGLYLGHDGRVTDERRQNDRPL